MMELDPRLRRRLSSLAAQERSPLGPLERQRILTRAREAEAARRPGSRAFAALLGLLAAGAAAAGLHALRPLAFEAAVGGGVVAGGEDGVLAGTAKRRAKEPAAPREPGEGALARALAAPPPRCATEEVPEARERGDRRGRVVELGDRARFVLADGAAGALLRASPCATVFELASGELAVHARDLAGGELVVRTVSGDVVVHGTIFSVALARPAAGGARLSPGGAGRGAALPPPLRVSVAEGEVGIVVRGGAAGGGDLALARLREGDGARVERSLDALGEVVLTDTLLDASREVEALVARVTRSPRPRASRPRERADRGPVDGRGLGHGGGSVGHEGFVRRRGEVTEGAVEIRRGHPLLRMSTRPSLLPEAPAEAPIDDLP